MLYHVDWYKAADIEKDHGAFIFNITNSKKCWKLWVQYTGHGDGLVEGCQVTGRLIVVLPVLK